MNIDRVFYEIKIYIDYLGDAYKQKIPEKLYNKIEKIANEYILTNPSEKIELKDLDTNEYILSKDTKAFLFSIDYNYFTESEEEKQALLNILKENEKEQSEMTKNLFNKTKKSSKELQDEQTLNEMYKRIMLLNKYLD